MSLLITRGLGNSQLLPTRGLGGILSPRSDSRGDDAFKSIRRRIRREEIYDIKLPVFHEREQDQGVYVSISRTQFERLGVYSPLVREVSEVYDVTGKLSYKKLRRILSSI